MMHAPATPRRRPQRLRPPTVLLALLLAAALAACGARPTAPAASDLHSASTPRAAPATRAPPPSHTPTPVASPASSPTPATPFEQYRAWMAEARALYPYGEPLEAMWDVMICESRGDPDLVAGDYHGLFQYSSETWDGDWNPYRHSSILDPRAQIFATAKAWQDGNQGWWGCYA